MPLSPKARRWAGLSFIALGVSLIVIDTTIVNVVVPSLVSQLGISSAQAQWVQGSYPVMLAGLLLLTGRLSDLFGARQCFLAGVGLFVLASVLAGTAATGGVLVGARFLQGAAAAMIMPTSLALVNTAFSGVERGRAFAIWGATLGVSAAIGPLLGGALAELSWRWVFGINVPLGAVIIIGVALLVDPSTRTKGTVDVPGAVLSVAGLGLLSFALIEGRSYGWITTTRPVEIFGLSWNEGPSIVLLSLVIAAVVLIVFVRRQRTLTRNGNVEPLMTVQLFSIRSFRYGNITLLIIGLGELGIIAVLPLWLQFALGYTPLQSGLSLVPLAAGTFLASTLSIGMIARFTAVQLVRLGLLLEVVGLAALGLSASPELVWWPIALALMVLGVGNGFASAQIANVILGEVPASNAGRGSAVQGASAQLGSALGIAVLTTIFYSVLGFATSNRLTGAGFDSAHAENIASSITSSGGAVVPSLITNPRGAETVDIARTAMTQGISAVGYVAGGLLVVALLATMLIPQPTPAQPDTASTGVDEASGDHSDIEESNRS